MPVTVISTIKPKNNGSFPVAEAEDIVVAGNKRLNIVLAEIQEKIGTVALEPLQITAFSVSTSLAEKGSTINQIILTWKLNRMPHTLFLDNVSIDSAAESRTFNELGLTTDKIWTLEATDEKGISTNKTVSLKFVNGIYYGTSTEATYNSGFILGLHKILSDTKSHTVTVNASQGEYFFYCVPSRLGECSFNVGGFDGGIDKIDTVEFTNASGFTESYDIYRSVHASLGDMSISVK